MPKEDRPIDGLAAVGATREELEWGLEGAYGPSLRRPPSTAAALPPIQEAAMELILQPEEAQLLRQVLTQHTSDLKMEIGKTENYAWRQAQKHDVEVLRAIVGRLDQAVDDEEAPEPVERVAEQTLQP